MENSEKTLLHPLGELLFLLQILQIPTSLSDQLKTLNALVDDLGTNMNLEIQKRWNEKLTGLKNNCGSISVGLTGDVKSFLVVSLQSLEGRFYEVVGKDYAKASRCYEDAAITLGSMNLKQRMKLDDYLILFEYSGDSSHNISSGQKGTAVEDQEIKTAIIPHSFAFRLPEAGLWDWAGDAYYRAGGREADARRCYEEGIKVIQNVMVPELEKFGLLMNASRHMLTHLSLSLASSLLAESDEWDKVESLYRKTADTIFFGRISKSNDEYRDICSIMVYGTKIFLVDFTEPEWLPHIPLPTDKAQATKMVRLNAEIGQRALDILKADYEKSKEGFPVPETYHLVALLSESYIILKEYEKCKNLVSQGKSFDEDFWSWSYEKLSETYEWGFTFITHTENSSLAMGLLQRPDFQDFIKEMNEFKDKFEERGQRHEWRQLRMEKKIDELGRQVTIEEEEKRLAHEYPWFNELLNPGSLVNAEVLYSQLKKRNWGEVVIGYCNAVEEELKQYLYKEYLAFVAEKFDHNYLEDSQRQEKQGSVLYYISSLPSHHVKYRLWEQFVETRLLNHKDFLLGDFFTLVGNLVAPRGPSAHGKMQERQKALLAREIVFGTPNEPGLLSKLVTLRKPDNK